MKQSRKAIAYIRTDLADQTKFGSEKLKLQEKQITEYAKNQNLKIIEWFKQVGYEPITFLHSELSKALELCENDPDIQYLIVSKTDHLSHSVEVYYFWKISFERIGVTIVSSNSSGNSSKNKSLMDSILESRNLAVNQRYRVSSSVAMERGIQAKKVSEA